MDSLIMLLEKDFVTETELPVLPKTVQAKTNSKGVVLTPFEAKIIRLKENDKTDKNVCDTVLGCKGGCFGCYAEGGILTKWHNKIFANPVEQILVPHLMYKDTVTSIEKIAKTQDEPYNWVRCGVTGDPSYAWETTVRLAETVNLAGSRLVIITKFWKEPTEEQLIRLALSGAIFHWSVIAGYDWTEEFDPNTRVKGILDILTRYKEMTPQESVFMRLCTFPWLKGQPIEDIDEVTETDAEGNTVVITEAVKGGMGDIFWHAQEAFRDLSEELSFRLLETPWRFQVNKDPRVAHMDPARLSHPKSYKALKQTGEIVKVKSRKWGGPQYFETGEGDEEDLDHPIWTSRDTHAIGCLTDCPSCPNQCGTRHAEDSKRNEMASKIPLVGLRLNKD